MKKSIVSRMMELSAKGISAASNILDMIDNKELQRTDEKRIRKLFAAHTKEEKRRK